MPASFLLHLRPQRPAPMHKHTGRWLNGLLYALLEESNPPLATLVHDGLNPKPFTTSLLEGRFAQREGLAWAVPEETYRVRYTVLTDAVYGALGEALLERFLARTPLEIGGRPFLLERVGVAPHERDPWVGVQSYEALVTHASPTREITLHFASPTAFKAGDLHLMFPQPWNVFGSLQRNWQAFCEHPLPDDLVPFTEQQVAVSRYELATEVIAAGQYQLKGFVGQCTYLVKGSDAPYLAALNTLANFALYAGVGMKSTQGMGQTRRVR